MIELVGKYTTAKIFAETIEEGVYSQVYDINLNLGVCQRKCLFLYIKMFIFIYYERFSKCYT